MNAPLYTVEILRLAASLPEPMTLARTHGSAEARSPTCGSVVRTQVAMSPNGRVEAMSQQVQACAFGQASAALAADFAVGLDRIEIEHALDDLTAWLEGRSESAGRWSALAPARSRKARHGAILLPLRALLQAIDSTS